MATTVTAVTPSGTGYMRAYPAGTAVPTASILHFVKGQYESNTPTLSIAATSGKALRLLSTRKTHVVVDVFGYYAPQLTAFVSAGGVLTYASTRGVTSTRTGLGLYTVTFSRDVSTCAFQATPYAYNYVVAAGPNGSNSVNLFVHTEAPAVFHDTSFSLTVTC